jgi:acetylornithine deacetylase/succinyl-diaminopimelate desuccinylase-like protein
MITARKIATKHRGLATVGIIKVEPGSVNTVPGRVTMSMDMRHPNDAALTRMIDELEQTAKRLVEMLRRKEAYPLKIKFGMSLYTTLHVKKTTYWCWRRCLIQMSC